MNPPNAVALSEYAAAPPGDTVAEVAEPGGAAIVKSSPVPASAMVWGLPSAVSATDIAAVLDPPAAGSKVTLRVQLALTATVEPQSLVWEASWLEVMPAMLRAAPPVLVRVMLWTLLTVPTVWAGKVKEEGENVTFVEAPVPARLTV